MNRLFNRLIKSRFLQNTGWIVFAQIYQMVLSLIIGVVSARYLGPSNYGTMNYAASYISFFTIFSALGLEGIVVKEMINNRSNEGEILGTSIFLRFMAGILSMISVCLIVCFLNPKDNILLIVVFLQSFVLPFNAFNIIDTWYQSKLNSKISTLIKCISYTFMSLYKIILLVTGKSVEWFAFSTSLDSLLIAIMFVLMYRKQGIKQLCIDFKLPKILLNQSYHLIISYMMAVLYSQMDRIMIGKMIGQTEVGYYTAAATICNMWVFIPQAFVNSARPIIMGLKGKDEDIYQRRLKQLLAFVFWVGVAFSIAITIMSGLIVNILYGKQYIMAKGPLVIIIWSTIFSSLSYPRSIWMICENKQKYTKYILIWGVLVNLVLNYFGIKKFGINGAAIATLITEIVTCVVAPWFYKDTRIFVKYIFKSIPLKNVSSLIRMKLKGRI